MLALSYYAQDNPMRRNDLAQNVNDAEVPH